MNVLAIGNSFSQNAMANLHDIARADGVKLNVANLYIGGCVLEHHYRNMLGDRKEYVLQYNGQHTGFKVTMEEALLNRKWDVITLQQGSTQSFCADSYEPYISELADYVRQCQPKAKVLIHQTWAYEQGSAKLTEVAGYETAQAMFADVKSAYAKAAEIINADGTIPSGEMMMRLWEQGITNLYQDTFHASQGLGQYALGLLWYRMLTGNAVAENSFCDFCAPVTEEEVAAAKACVDSFQPIL